MKNACISKYLFLLFVLFVSKANAQLNSTVSSYYDFGNPSLQTITSDSHGDIYCISKIPGSGAGYDILKFDASGTCIATLGFEARLTPVSLYMNSQDELVVAGNYSGSVPSGMHPSLVGNVNTVFCAKYDNALNEVWFHLIESHLLFPSPGYNHVIVNIGIAPNPTGSGVENYILLNDADNDWSVHYTPFLIEIDDLGVPIAANVFGPGTSGLPSSSFYNNNYVLKSIEYVSNGDYHIVTGINYDAATPSPFIFTTDGVWLTNEPVSYDISPYSVFDISNATTLDADPSKIYFSAITNRTFVPDHMCHNYGPGHAVLLMAVDLNDLTNILLSNVYVPRCDFHLIGNIGLKQFNDGTENLLVCGLTEHSIDDNNLNTRTISFFPIEEYGTPHNISNIDKLSYPMSFMQSFTNHRQDPNTFVVHGHADLGSATYATKVLITDNVGHTYCSSSEEVFSEAVELIPDEFVREDYSYLPHEVRYIPQYSYPSRPPNTICDYEYRNNATNIAENKWNTKSIYPTILHSNEQIHITGYLQEGAKVYMIDMLGIKVEITPTYSNDEMLIDLPTQLPGIYLLHIVSKTSHKTQKITIL